MRDRYDDSPQRSRDDGLRRLGRLTWRTTQLGALATVGFAIVFARAVPAQTAAHDTTPPASPSTAHTAAPSALKHRAKAARTGKSPVASRSAAGQSVPATAPAGQPSAQPSVQPSAAPTTPRATPTLAPPSTPPAPAPSSSSPAPTATSTTHGGG